MTKSAALRSQGGSRRAEADRASPAPAPAPPPAPEAPTAPQPGGADAPPSATVPPTPARQLWAKAGDTATLDLILREVRAVRDAQQLILKALEGRRREPAPARLDDVGEGTPPAGVAFDLDSAPGLAPIRDRRRRSVLLVDDDPRTREAAVAELLHADVPVRAYDEGNAALAAIAEEKPDVIALEIGLGGEMSGKDLVNMIKATMEWVDIPIVLWTREAVASQKEARQVHGADEVVLKSGGPAALAARVITVFRRA
jgi:CheY-like chemotaxis protein